MPTRVHLLAKELGLSSKDLIAKLKALKIKVKGHMSALDDETAEIIKRELAGPAKKARAPKRVAAKQVAKAAPVVTKDEKEGQGSRVKGQGSRVKGQENTIPCPLPLAPGPSAATEPAAPAPQVKPEIKAQAVPATEKPLTKEPEIKEAVSLKELEADLPINVKQLSVKLGVKPSILIAGLMKKGVFVNINQNLDEARAREIAASYGYKIKKSMTLEEELKKDDEEEKVKAPLVTRFPVVTFMGHVDHGKTSLLDYIRKTKVAAKEKGGITQHIGAYRVELKKGSVTFLDTPGHEAFTAMRSRGANATDIVVLVIAADDGIMPQTKEAIDHARAANVPIVVAINKCDLPNISLDKVKRQLSELNLLSEDWGGKTITVPVSAKTGQGIDNLLEMLLLEAEILELKANPHIRARGVVIEAKISSGKGIVATLLVKNGTLKVGDTILSGLYYGKIKAMNNDKGSRILEAPPSTPVEVLGLGGVPEAGDEFFVVKDEKKAKTLSLLKQDEKKLKRIGASQRISLEHLYDQIKEGIARELKVVLKADVQGSVEALSGLLENLSTKEVKLKIMHMGVGNINESDVMLALVSNAVIIGFHAKIEPSAETAAKKEEVDVRRYDIIYEAVNDIKAAMEGLLEPAEKEIFQGRARVQEVFKVSKIGFVAGSIVVKGTIVRSNPVRLLRANQEIYRGKMRSLKRFKDDVRDVNEGVECGIALEGHNDIKKGDIIESFTVEKIARRLDSDKK